MSSIPVFSFAAHTNGNTIFAADPDTVYAAIKVTLDALIADHNKTPILPASFTGTNEIPNVPLANCLLYIDATGNMSVLPAQPLIDAEVNAAASAASALSSYTAALTLGSLLPDQTGKAGFALTTNGAQSSWSVSAAESLAILNFIGY